jgi:damage-control phosphatase, subfamily I
MNTCLDCLPCFVRQTLDAARMSSDDPTVHEQILRDVLRWMSDLNLSMSPPAFAERIHRRLRELTGVNDPYAAEKKLHNEMAKRALPALRRDLEISDDALLTAVNFSIAGNIIDLGAKTGLKESDLVEAIEHAAQNALHGDTDAFCSAVRSAGKILYLCDNAGEIVFDALLIEQLGPERVTAAVRGKPIINDALMEDARTAGLDRLVRVVENGSGVPGTLLSDCSEEFRVLFEQADLIVSKGQGNFETLSASDRPVFFLFKVKCPVVAETAGVPLGTHVLRRARP